MAKSKENVERKINEARKTNKKCKEEDKKISRQSNKAAMNVK